MDYLLHIMVMIALYAILTTSLNLLIGFAGLFALSHAAFYAAGAYTTAILTTRYGIPFPIPLLCGVVITAGIGALVALPALRIGSHYLVIVTLALQVIVLSILLNGGHFTGGSDGIKGIPRIELFGYRLGSPASFLPLAVLVAAICYWVCWRLAHSPFGRSLKAMRENEAATQAIGKNIVAMKVTAFAFSAGLASVAGSLLAQYYGFVGTEGFTMQETVYVLAMLILGGRANLTGSVVGALILVLLPQALKYVDLRPDLSDMMRQVIYGMMLILILRFRPQGILPEANTALHLSKVPRVTVAETLNAPGNEAAGTVTVAARNLAKRFGGIVAINDFSIELQRGRITGLIGPNGAGKTTAFNMLTGFLQPNAGEITFRGKPLAGLKPHQIVRAGMARSFQDLKLFTGMTVLENVIVALPDQAGDNLLDVYFRPGKVAREEGENYARALAILEFVKLDAKAHERAEDLSYAEEKLLVIARLLATGAEVLLFDEPLSGLDHRTLEEIYPIVRSLADRGKTICIIEHNLDVIRGLCDNAAFLDEGRGLAYGTPEQIISDPALAERYFK
jgi:ABC-type branched-subunit amino acid transport system ATPase component/ABC-type branched-subunit amino acid transport system permease subunit